MPEELNHTDMDKLTKEQRHRCMSSIKSKNTKPELLVRRFLFSRGFRYRLNHPRLPGHPDLVLRKYRTVIFINGCFWHGHEGCKLYNIPKTNTGYWAKKIKRNQERDKEVKLKLNKMGWHYITIWECELKPSNRNKTLESLLYTLNRILLLNYGAKTYKTIEDETSIMAAENQDAGYFKTTQA